MTDKILGVTGATCSANRMIRAIGVWLVASWAIADAGQGFPGCKSHTRIAQMPFASQVPPAGQSKAQDLIAKRFSSKQIPEDLSI
jgi:hypothetical protein